MVKQSDETITFPCTHCGSPLHAAQAHGYYPFTGQKAIPVRYRALQPPSLQTDASPTYQPPGDLDADGKLRDERAMQPMSERVFVLKPRSAMGDAGFALYERSGQNDWMMAKELAEELAFSIATLLRNAGATLIDERAPKVYEHQLTVYPKRVFVPDGDPCDRCPRTVGRGGRYVRFDRAAQQWCARCIATVAKQEDVHVTREQ